jgi:hypothetical protein
MFRSHSRCEVYRLRAVLARAPEGGERLEMPPDSEAARNGPVDHLQELGPRLAAGSGLAERRRIAARTGTAADSPST